jgi:hypothetical protein
MEILITENQYKLLKEQNLFARALESRDGIQTLVKLIVNGIDKITNYVEVIRPKIENMGKKLFPANEMILKNPKLKGTKEYRELKDKEDAFDHQLASAVASSMFGPQFSEILGYANEIKGGLRMFFKGSKSQNIGRFEQFTSGWAEDNANNKIGIELGKQHRNKSLEELSRIVVGNINSGNYYDSTGKKPINIR